MLTINKKKTLKFLWKEEKELKKQRRIMEEEEDIFERVSNEEFTYEAILLWDLSFYSHNRMGQERVRTQHASQIIDSEHLPTLPK